MAGLIDAVAWAGAAGALVAYFLLASGRIKVRTFNWSEFISAFPLSVSAISHKAYPALVITVAYGLIGFYGLVRRA